jgi:hypothetical protein
MPQPKQHNQSHGSPYDRGSADSYYRGDPVTNLTPDQLEAYHGDPVTNLTPDQLEAYHAGYNHNEAEQNFKDYI